MQLSWLVMRRVMLQAEQVLPDLRLDHALVIPARSFADSQDFKTLS